MPQIRRGCYGTRHSSFLRGELWRTRCARKKDGMSFRDQFALLKNRLGCFRGKRHLDAWESVQAWKEEAVEAVEHAFYGVSEERNKITKRIKRLFMALPCCGNIQMDPRKSDAAAQTAFDADIDSACSIMDECISICGKLKNQFN